MLIEALTIVAGLVLALVFLVGRRWLRWRRLKRHIDETLPPVIMDAMNRPTSLFSLFPSAIDDWRMNWGQEIPRETLATSATMRSANSSGDIAGLHVDLVIVDDPSEWKALHEDDDDDGH